MITQNGSYNHHYIRIVELNCQYVKRNGKLHCYHCGKRATFLVLYCYQLQYHLRCW